MFLSTQCRPQFSLIYIVPDAVACRKQSIPMCDSEVALPSRRTARSFGEILKE